MAGCVVLGHQDELPSLQDQECFTVGARAGQEAKVGGQERLTGQKSPRTRDKRLAFYWSRISSVHSRKAEIIIFNNDIVTTFKLIYNEYNSFTIQLTILRANPTITSSIHQIVRFLMLAKRHN